MARTTVKNLVFCLCWRLGKSTAHAVSTRSFSNVNFIFYYLWYGNPNHNGSWEHWDHEVLPHWTEKENSRHPTVGTQHEPPQSLHSPFYPQRGPYSSTDPKLLREHFSEIRSMQPSSSNEIVAVLSWWGQQSREGTTDTQGIHTDGRIQAALEAAVEVGIKVAWHMEPYEGRTSVSVKEDVLYLEATYGQSPAVYRVGKERRSVFFVYDSYHVNPKDWAFVLRDDPDKTMSSLGVFIGLWLNKGHGRDLALGGFDGFYTYFASIGFSFGSTPRNWSWMCQEGRVYKLLSVLSVGPGYDDTRIRPWNAHNTKRRNEGTYFDNMFEAAIRAGPDAISITSFNEWGEGTQIEPAVPHQEYKDYGKGGPNLYIHKTKFWLQEFEQMKNKPTEAREL